MNCPRISAKESKRMTPNKCTKSFATLTGTLRRDAVRALCARRYAPSKLLRVFGCIRPGDARLETFDFPSSVQRPVAALDNPAA